MKYEILELLYDKMFNNDLTDEQRDLYYEIGMASISREDEPFIVVGTEDRTYKINIEDITGEL